MCNVTQFILSGKLLYMLRVVPSSGAQTTLSTASGISHTVTATCRYSGFFAPDDGWYHPKHVEQFPDKINCGTLHIVGYILEYSNNARYHER
jgi:hypothetical protein